MPWFMYQRGGWRLAICAINRKDADKYAKWDAPGAKFVGEFTPIPMTRGFDTATAAVTPAMVEKYNGNK